MSMFLKKTKLMFLIFLIGLFLVNFNVVLAFDSGLFDTANHAGITTANISTNTSLAAIIGKIIGAFLSFLGVIFLVLVVYGGFMWMTAGGNTDQVTKARQVIINSAIGFLIVMLAYTITSFVTTELTTTVLGTG